MLLSAKCTILCFLAVKQVDYRNVFGPTRAFPERLRAGFWILTGRSS